MTRPAALRPSTPKALLDEIRAWVEIESPTTDAAARQPR